MKRLLLVALGLLFLSAGFSPAATNAQKDTKKQLEFGVDAGVAVPLSPSALTDAYGLGIGGGVFGRYRVTPGTSVGLNVAYNSFKGKTVNGVDAPTFSTLEVLAQGKTKFGKGSARPYVLYGVGLCNSRTASKTYTVSGDLMGIPYSYNLTMPAVSSTDFELQPGFGVEFGNKTTFFAETKLSMVLTSGDTTMFLPVNVGVQF